MTAGSPRTPARRVRNRRKTDGPENGTGFLKCGISDADKSLVGSHREGRLLRASGLAAAATALFATWIVVGVGGETSVRYVDDLATIGAALAATGLCVRVGGGHEGRLRLFWWLLAGATGAWALGEFFWAWYDLGGGGGVPVPSWADAAYLAGIPLAAAALLAHPAMRGRTIGKARSLLDGVVIAAALFLLGWTLVLGPIWRTSDLSTLGGAVTFAYPVGDIVILFLVVLVIRGTVRGDRLDLWCLLAGLLALTLSDSIYGYLTQVKDYETGNVIDVGWFAGYAAIGVGAFCSRAERVTDGTIESRSLTPAAVVVPFLPMLAALSLTAIWIELGHRLDCVAWTTAVALVAMVLVRQALLVIDLLRLGGKEASVADRLVLAVDGTVAHDRAEPAAASSSAP